MIQLKRLRSEPVLTPKKYNPWEAGAVFNCGAIYYNGLVHLIYRATDISSNGVHGRYINSLGYAVSVDGVHFNRLENPILVNSVPQESRGPEDPRITKIGDTFFMLYTGYGGRFDGDYRICLATSQNLIAWKRQGVVLDESNKDAALFPEKIEGKYLMFHRRPPDIWMAYSDDLKTWQNHRIVASPVSESRWESVKVGIAGPPIKTPDGWLLIYHGVGEGSRYSLGAMLLDLNDPSKIIARQKEPILEPALVWEKEGYVPNVVFSCGQAVIGDEIYVYYGAADTVIGVAKMSFHDVRF
ncbi:MAG TPA: glycosidase [Anaerolineae bacterium]|nr:glycosidase [Anaerolineae bacterium]